MGVIKGYIMPEGIENNISSNSKGLFAALTNPTELARRKGNLDRSYPVTDKNGVIWLDAESAYHRFKSKNKDTIRDEFVMTKIIQAKLTQHPQLISEINKRGGIEFLKSCSHIIGIKNSRWEGIGINSRFIRCLIEAYENVINSANYIE